MNHVKLFAGIAASVLLLEGCKKEHFDLPPTPTNGQLKIVSNNSYLPGAQIDSAFLIWPTLNGQESAAFALQGNSEGWQRKRYRRNKRTARLR